ncbi:MAG: Fe-S-cluster containining protein [Pseudohongiellaceae bacterium]
MSEEVDQDQIPSPEPGEDGVPWYAKGLSFSCTACGKCCLNHGEGYQYVFSTRAERRRIAKYMGLSLRGFESEFCKPVLGSLSFTSAGDACVFLEDGRCSIYELRPNQCRTFPFWPEVLADQDTWDRDVASFCPGVGAGEFFDLNAIRKRMAEVRG